MLNVAMPRGLAAGVLATLPLHRGIEGVENLAPGVFALIVFSVLFFARSGYTASRGKRTGSPGNTQRPRRQQR